MTTEHPTYHKKAFSVRPIHSEDISEIAFKQAQDDLAKNAFKQFEDELIRQITANIGIPAEMFTASNPHTGARDPVDFDKMKRAEPVPTKSTLLLQ